MPRAAAFENRIAACVTACLLPDVFTPVVQTMGVEKLLAAGGAVEGDQLTTKQRYALEEGMPRFGLLNGVRDLAAWGAQMRQMNLWGLQDRIICPVLNISATGEGRGMYDSAHRFSEALPDPRKRFVLTTEEQGGELHTVRGNSSLLHQIEFDWLDDIFGS